MKINNAATIKKIRWTIGRKTLLVHFGFGFRFNLIMCFFVFWTLLQASMAMQFLPLDIVQATNYLKAVLPALGILACCIIYLDRLKINNLFLPFILFCLFAFCNVCLHMIITGVRDLKYLSQPIMFLIWTFGIFVLAPSVFDNLSKVRQLLFLTTFALVITVVFASYWSYTHGFEIVRSYAGSRQGGSRYSFVYLNPGYLGGICYSIVCISLMLRELSTVRWQKTITLLFILISSLAMILASSRTYILASLILFLFYFWNKGGILKIFSWALLVFTSLFFIRVLWQLSIEGNYFDVINFQSSSRLLMWSQYWKDMMIKGIEWKLFIGNGIYSPDWIQGIVLAEGRAAKSFSRLAIDNTYIEMVIMHGAVGIILFVWGMARIIAKGNMFKKLKGTIEKDKLRTLLSIAYGSLLGILAGAFFNSNFPSVGNTLNSIVFPTSMAVIFIVAREIRPINKQATG